MAVPILEMIGLIGNWSTFPFSGSLRTLAVPWNLPGHDPVGYMVEYSCAGKLLLVFRKTCWII